MRSTTCRTNAAVTFAVGLVAPMLPAFMRRYSNVRIVLETENRLVDLAREEVDVAIRVGQLADSDLMARKLGTVALWPCASPAYLAERGVPTTPDALSDHALLGWLDRPSEWVFGGADGTQHRTPVPVGTVAPEPAVLQMLLIGGAGIGRLPDFLARPRVAAGELVRLLPDYRTETVDVHAVYPAHRSLSAKVPRARGQRPGRRLTLGGATVTMSSRLDEHEFMQPFPGPETAAVQLLPISASGPAP